MKKTLAGLIVVLCVGLTSCAKETETSTRVGSEFKVETLFTHDGCTLNRFYDSGWFHYYANCRNNSSTMSPQSCGKGCSTESQITTSYKD